MDKESNKFNNSEEGMFTQWPFYINGRDDVIFIHIPKTAGTSIEYSLDFNQPNKEKGIRKHNSASRIISIIGKKKWDENFKFTFIRNPWDRLLSHYSFRLRKEKILNPDHQESFKKWALDMFTIEDSNSRSKFNLSPQVDWLKDNDGLIRMSFIGRFEQIEEDFGQLTNLLSLPVDLMHLNANPKKLNYREHYDSELKLQVARFYEEDIDMFKYTF